MSGGDEELSSRLSKRQKTTHDAPPVARAVRSCSAAVPTAAAHAVSDAGDHASIETHRQSPSALSAPSSPAPSSSPQLLDIPRPVLEHIFSFVARVSCFTFAPLGPQRLYEETPSLALACSVWNDIASGFRSEFRAISTIIKFKSGQMSELDAIYQGLEARGAKILELELHMGTPQSRGLFKLEKQLRPLSKLDELSIDWDRIFKACPSLLRLNLTHLPLDSVHISRILHAASSHLRDLEALILPAAEVKPEDQPGIILRTTNILYSALERWYINGSKRGLKQLAVAKHHNVEEEDLQARSDEFISAVARFCPNIEYLDGWKATYSDANGLSCDEMWFCSLDIWKLFCRNCVHIREFNWFTAPFDDDFLKEFALYPKRNLKKMTIAVGGDGVYHPAFSDGSYHRHGGFRFTIEAVSGILAACPALEELHVLLEGFRSQSMLFKKRLNDDFLAAVANQCPNLRKLIVNEVIGTHFEHPLWQVEDAGLLSISRLPQLEHVAFMQTLTSVEGILSLVDNARCRRRIVLKVGSASALHHMEYFSVLSVLMRILASRPPESFRDHPFELELVIHEERKKISKQDALKATLTELLEQVRKQHSEIAVYFCEWREKLDQVCDDLNNLESVVFFKTCARLHGFDWLLTLLHDSVLDIFAAYPKLELKKLVFACEETFADPDYLPQCFSLYHKGVPYVKRLAVAEWAADGRAKLLDGITGAGLIAISRLPKLEHAVVKQANASVEGILGDAHRKLTRSQLKRRMVMTLGCQEDYDHRCFFEELEEFVELLLQLPDNSFQGHRFELEFQVRKVVEPKPPSVWMIEKPIALAKLVMVRHVSVGVHFMKICHPALEPPTIISEVQ